MFTQAEADQQDKNTYPLVRKYFMHNIGHFMGYPRCGRPRCGFEEVWSPAVNGGIYIPEEGIGVRIETDMLIAAPIDLMAQLPSASKDIEKMMKA